jgi:6-phosphogluconolactonase
VSAPILSIFRDRRALYKAAAEAFTALAREAVSQRNLFTVALSGGSTPRGLYELLADETYREQIAWGDGHIFWGDERAVPADHAESNYKSAFDSLLSHVPVNRLKVHRMRGEEANLQQAALDYQRLIAAAFGVSPTGTPPRFDLILLGLGEDGHTASLFPDTQAVQETDRWVVANDVPQKNMRRLTMTLPIINRARHVLFLVTGESKAAVLSEILDGPWDPARLPAQAVQPQDGELHWLVDKRAAARLPTGK